MKRQEIDHKRDYFYEVKKFLLIIIQFIYKFCYCLLGFTIIVV